MRNESINEDVPVPRRLLVLDTHRFFQKLSEGIFIESGCWISLATTQREALIALIRNSFDALLVSVSPEHDDDIEFVRTVASYVPWLAILAVTEGDDAAAACFQKAGAEIVVNRSVSLQRLGAILRKTSSTLKSEDAATQLVGREQQRLVNAMSEGLQEALKTNNLSESIGIVLTAMAPYLRLRAAAVLDWGGEYPSLRVFAADKTQMHELSENFRELLLERADRLNDSKLSWTELETIPRCTDAFQSEPGWQSQFEPIAIPCFAGDALCGLFAVCPDHSLCNNERFLLHQLPVQLWRLGDVVDIIRRQAMYDSLTGLLNRLYLEDFLEKTLESSVRYGRGFSLVLLDLDHFKRVNDRYGHVIGDAVLKEFAQLVSSEARHADVVGRYGGEEFLTILPNTDSRGSIVFTRRLLAAIRNHDFCSSGQNLNLSASAGVVTFDPASTESKNLRSTDLLIQTDSALYAAKNRGRDRAVTWPELTEFALPGRLDETIEPHSSEADTEDFAPLAPLRILLVDDEHNIRFSLSRLLANRDYNVTTAGSGAEALELFEKEPQLVDLLITDLAMPEIDGIELIRRVAAISPETVFVVMTGAATVEYAVESVKSGVFAFLEKPVRFKDLLAVLRRVEQQRRERRADSAYHELLEHTLEEQGRQLELTVEKVQQSYQFTLEAMVNLLDARERDSCLHCVRVRELTRIIGQKLGFEGEDLDILDQGALLHDVGKIGIPDEILLKPGPLTNEEWKIMRQHPTIGYRILCKAPWLTPVAEIVYSHHERYDGTGYPRRLGGEKICLGARIFSIADAYDAIRSPRVYKTSRSAEDAVQEIQKGRGSHFDPDLVDVFMSYLDLISDTWEQQCMRSSS